MMQHTPRQRPIYAQHGVNGLETQTNKAVSAGYPASIYFLFLFFAIYLAVPVIDIPFLGLSLSAPIFFPIALAVFLRPPRPWLATYRGWVGIAVALWLGMFLSAVVNGFSNSASQIDRDELLLLVQFAYWFLVYVATTYLISSQGELVKRIVGAIAVGVVALALFRLGEAALEGAIGAWTKLQLLSQNGYGIQFSMFYPILLSFVYWGSHRKLAALSVLAVLAAILINGSRSGWLAALAGTLIFLWMLIRTQRQRVRSVFVLLVIVAMMGLVAWFAPAEVVADFEARFDTFQNLEEDKSYAIRQLMVQKGIRLFAENPWFGVGISRWLKESVPLEIPQVLSYASQAHFDAKSSHNSYISYLAESGLVGTIPLVILLFILGTRGYRAAIRLASHGYIWAIGVYAGFVGMSIHLWALSGLTGTAPWFVYGLVSAMIILDRQTFRAKNHVFHTPRLSLSRTGYR